jgi:hypothetical protein
MLLSDRRRGLIYFCLAGIEIAWITPFVGLLLYVQEWGLSPLAVFGRLFAILLLWMLALEFLNRLKVDSPGYELMVLGLIVLGSLLLVRFWLHASTPLSDFGWLHSILNALFNFHQGLRPELVVILTSLLLWQRAASATSRSLDFFDVGVSFRLGILLLILGAGLLSHVTSQDVTILLWLYLGFGLTAVALARLDEKAAGARSAGKMLPLPRLGQLLAAVGFTVCSVALLSLVYTPAGIKTVLGWLKPLWTLLGLLLLPLIQVLLLVAEVVLRVLEWLLGQLMSALDLGVLETALERLTQLAELAQRNRGDPLTLPPWAVTGLRYGAVVLAILLILGFVLLYLARIRRRPPREGVEEEIGEEITLGGGMMSRGMRWLRDMAGLVRRFGLSRQLLAAVSVQNIYANLCRLASQRGYPRHPAQPPDHYLPVLAQVFVGQEEALARITATYMRVHYGEQPVSSAELAQIREDYDELQAAEKVTHRL